MEAAFEREKKKKGGRTGEGKKLLTNPAGPEQIKKKEMRDVEESEDAGEEEER